MIFKKQNISYLFEDDYKAISEQKFFSDLPFILANTKLEITSEFNDLEIVDLFLTDNRKIEKAILIDRKYLVANIRRVDENQIARDRYTDFSVYLKPTIFKLFNFSTIDILKVCKSDLPFKTRIIDLETRLIQLR